LGLNAYTDKGIISGLQSPNSNNYINFRAYGDLEITSISSGIYMSAPYDINLLSHSDLRLTGYNNVILYTDNTYIKLDNNSVSYNVNNIISNIDYTEQSTSITENVTQNNSKAFNHVLTYTATTTTQGNSVFNVFNDNVISLSLINISINKYTGNQGLPSVYISNITNGNFSVNISNHSITESLNGQLKIAYSIVNPFV
jgi:hypothetical protein